MPGITNPAEEYFKDGLWAWATDKWEKLVSSGGILHTALHGWTGATWKELAVDAQGLPKIKISAQAIDVEVKQTTPADLTPGVCGWDGDSWQKLPMVWGYSSGYCDALTGEAEGGGNADVIFGTVDPGEIWVIESVATDHDSAAAKHLNIRAYNNGCYQVILDIPEADPGMFHVWNGRLTLPTGGNMFARLYAPGAGKKINMKVWGYKMKIAE